MKVIKRISDNLVVFAERNLKLTSEGARGNDWETSVVNNSDHILENVSELPSGFIPGKWIYNNGTWTRTPDEENKWLEIAKDIKNKELLSLHDDTVYADIVYNNVTFLADAHAQDLLVKVCAVGVVPANMYWRDKGKNKKNMTIADLRGLAELILKRAFEADMNLMNKLEVVKNALTVNEVANIKW